MQKQNVEPDLKNQISQIVLACMCSNFRGSNHINRSRQIKFNVANFEKSIY